MTRPRVNRALVRAPAGVVEHAGADSHVLTVHAEGQIPASFDCAGLKFRRLLTPGDIDLLPAGEPFRLVDEGANAVLVMLIPTSLVMRHADEIGCSVDRMRPLAGVRDPALSNLAWRLLRHEAPAPSLYEDCLTDELLGCLLRQRDPRCDPFAQDRIRALSGSRLRRVLDLIEAQLDGPLPIERLALAAGLGPTAFKLGFRLAMGEPVHRYVVRRRACRARLLLLERKLPASQIALEAGFAHQTHMARWLRRLFGILPSELEKLSVGARADALLPAADS